MILEHCSRASCVQIIDALRDRVAELTAVLEERDDMILSQAEGLAATHPAEHWQEDQLREIIEEQKRTIAALNDALGGPGSLTTDNLVRIGRLEAEIERLAANQVPEGCDEYADDPVYCGSAIRALEMKP